MFSERDLSIIAKRLAAWDKVYYSTLEGLVSLYPSPSAFLPDFLMPHPRRTDLFINPEICIAVTASSDSPVFRPVWTTASTADILRFLTNTTSLDTRDSDVGVAAGSRISPALNVALLSALPVLLEDPKFSGLWMASEVRGPDGTEIRSSSWELIRVFRNARANDWRIDEARTRAHSDVLLRTTRELLGLRSREADGEEVPDPKEQVGIALRTLAAEFETLLSDSEREEELQQFLTANPQLLDLRAISVDPKVPLGSEYVTDFVLRLPGEQYVLVEIERASHNLFTAAQNPSAALSHAVQQVEDWLEWAYDNLGYLRQRYPAIHEPRGLVVVGRRASLSDKGVKALRRRNTLNTIRVATYDDLLDDVRAIAANIETWASGAKVLGPQTM